MGGIKKGFGAGGKFWRSVNKVVDPLNIMDPMGVLPTSMIAGKKPFQWDKNYGGPLRNLFGGGGGTSSYSMPRSQMDMSGMFAGQNQMLANMQAQSSANVAKQNQMLANMRAQSSANITRQEDDLNQLRSSKPLFPTIPAPENSAQIAKSASIISAPATVAQSKIDGTTSVASDLPIEFVYKPATSTSKNIAANTFDLPDMSNIKFGGT